MDNVHFRFRRDFACATPDCGSIIAIHTYKAIVEGPGLEIVCANCRQRYIVTTDGAIPLTEDWNEQAQ